MVRPPNYTAVQTHANPENKLYLLCKLAAYWLPATRVYTYTWRNLFFSFFFSRDFRTRVYIQSGAAGGAAFNLRLIISASGVLVQRARARVSMTAMIINALFRARRLSGDERLPRNFQIYCTRRACIAAPPLLRCIIISSIYQR